jgi:hypothetical protein
MVSLVYKYSYVKEVLETENHRYVNTIYLNPHFNIFEYFRQNPDKIDWYIISKNPTNAAFKMLTKNIKKINPSGLVLNTNPKIGQLLEKTMIRFKSCHWKDLCASHNPTAMLFLEKHKRKIFWDVLSGNTSEGAIKILEKNIDKIDWGQLSSNHSAMEIIKNNLDKFSWEFFSDISPEKISWEGLSMNTSPEAIKILRQNYSYISWDELSANPAAIEIIEENMDIISWEELYTNPNAFHLFENQLFNEQYYINNFRSFMSNPKCLPFVQRILDDGLLPEADVKRLIICNDTSGIHQTAFELDYQAMSKIRNKIIYNELMSKTLRVTKMD